MSDQYIEGLKEVEEMYARFNPREMKSTIMSALKKAGKPIEQEMKGLVPVGPGYMGVEGWLKESIGIVPLKSGFGVGIGSRIKGGHRGNLGPLFEYGTKKVRRRYSMKNGSTGQITAYHWLSLGYNYSKDYAFSILENEWAKAVNRMAKRKGYDR